MGYTSFRYSSSTGYLTAEFQQLRDVQTPTDLNQPHSYPVFAPERILLVEWVWSTSPFGMSIHTYKWNGTNFGDYEAVWQLVGPGEPYNWDSNNFWNILCQISNDWLFVVENSWGSATAYEARIFAYRYNPLTRKYTDYPSSYYTYPTSDAAKLTFSGVEGLLTDQHFIISTKGRNSYYNSTPPQNGFTDVFALDRNNADAWRSNKTTILSQHDPSAKLTTLSAGINLVMVHSPKTGELKSCLFHGIDKNWGNSISVNRVSSIQEDDGNGLIRTQTLSYGSATFDLSLVTPGYSSARTAVSGCGGSTTYYQNALSNPLMRGASYLTTQEAEGTGAIVQIDSTYWQPHLGSGSPYLFELWKTRESRTLDGIVHAIDYDYSSTNGLPRRVFDHVGSPSNLSGNRDLLTLVSFGFEHSSSMRSANMLTQADRVSKYAVTQTHTTSPTYLTTSASTTKTVDDKQFSVNFPQTVTWTADCYNGSFCVGTYPGGNDLLYVDGNSQITSGSFSVEGDIVYYMESSVSGGALAPSGASPMSQGNHAIGTVNFDAGGYDPVLLSNDSTAYDPSTLYPSSTMKWDGSTWVTTGRVVSRDSYGQVQESENVDGVRTTTLYGYNSALPIASIVNTPKSQSAVSIFDDGDVSSWSGSYGTWSVQNGAYRQTDGTGTNQWLIPRTNNSATTNDGVFESDIRFDNSGTYRYAAVAKVVSAPYVMIRFELRKSESLAEIYATQTPMNSVTASGSFVFSENTWYHVKGEVQGTTARLYINGQLVVTLTNSFVSIGSGKVGLATYGTVASFDNVRMYPLGAIPSSTAYDPITLQAISQTDANLVSTYSLHDGFGRVTGTKNDDRKILESHSNYFSRDGHGGTYLSTDPNSATDVTYTSPNGHSDFTSSSGWGMSGDITFNTPMAGETTVRVGTISGEWDYFYKAAGQGNVVSRVDFYPDNTTGGTPHVLLFDGSGDRFAVQFDPVTSTFRMQTFIGGNGGYPHSFALPVVRNQWYTVEIEKDSLGRCYAWVGRKGEGRNYADMYSVSGYQPTWSPNIGFFSNADFFYLANFYMGSFSQSTTYSDGLGRSIQTQTRDGVRDLVSASEYDAQGRQYRSWRTYSYATGYAFDNAFASHAVSTLGSSNPYVESVYQTDPLSRLSSQRPVGRTSSNEDLIFTNGSAALDNGLSYQYSQSKQMPSSLKPWMVSREFTDRLGRTVRSSTYAEGIAGDTLTTKTTYNFLNAPTVRYAPKGDSTNFCYDFLGRLSRKINADEGTSKYIYDKAGRLRFMVDSVGLASVPDKVLYWKYDTFGRVIEKGYITSVSWGDGSTLQGYANTNPSFPATPATWRKKYAYDAGANGSGNLVGRLYSILTNNDDDTTAEVEEYFAYDRFGNVTSASQKVIDFNAATSYVTTYAYDLLGRNSEIIYPASSSGTVDVQYSYDQAGRTKSVNAAGGSAFGVYTYGLDGQLGTEQLNLGGPTSKTRTFSYDSKGRLTSIASDVFTETMTYDAGGYNGTETFYHGLMGSSNSAYYTGGPTSQLYRFGYDNFGRLTVADNTLDAMDVGVGSATAYDKNGNILSIKRGTSATMNYSYYSGQNRVKTRTTGTEYTYDVTGNMLSSTPKGLTSTYDPFTRLTMTANNSTYRNSFEYGGNKQRIYKNVYVVGPGFSTSTVYLHGINEYPLLEKGSSGTERANVYGPTGLIAFRDGSTWYYLAKDHLGSTRVVFNTSGSATSSFDFDALGSLQRGNINNNILYRFSGQEFDLETSLHNFRARNYDSDLGLFYAVDPAHQTKAPYSYCGGNPVIRVDRNGRIFWLIPVLIGAAIGGYSGYHIGEANGAHGWDLFAYAFAGATIGGLSGLASYAVSTSGAVMANTAGLAAGSFANSVGMSMLSGRNMAGISFGLGSFSFRTGQTDWIFDKDTKPLEGVSDAFSGISFLNDVVALNTVSYKDLREQETQVQSDLKREGSNLTSSDRFTSRIPYNEEEENWRSVGNGTEFAENEMSQGYARPLVGNLFSGPTDHFRIGRWHIGDFDPQNLGSLTQTYVHSDYFDINKNWLWHLLETMVTPTHPNYTAPITPSIR